MKESINKGANFGIANNDVTVKLNDAVNGLTLIAIATEGNQTFVASYGEPRSGMTFTSATEAQLNLAELNSNDVIKLDFFAVGQSTPLNSVDMEIICAANDIKSISIFNGDSNASSLGRIYLHNGAWKAKNLSESIIGGMDNIHTLFANPSLTSAIHRSLAPQQQNASAISMAPQQSNATQISMTAPNAPATQQQIQMSVPSAPHNTSPAQPSNTGTRPAFGRSTRIGGYTIDQEKVSEALTSAVSQGKGLFNRLVSFSSQKSREAADEVNRFRNKDLLMGTIAAGAYLAYADGDASASELRNLLTSLENHEYLKLFDHKDIVDCFNSYIETFKNDFDEGEIYVFETLTTLKGKVDESNIILAIALGVANADNNLTNDEERALKRIRLILDI